MERDHYQILGLEPTASKVAIATALQRLSDQAAVLVYTSPQRSHELWERTRQIREDLLLDPEQRAAYDRSLLAARAAIPVGPETVAAPAPFGNPAERHAPRRGALIWQTLGSAVVLALAVALFVVFGHRSRVNRTPGPLALALSTTGLQHKYHYVSGQMVQLRWSRVPHALVYRVQIAIGLHISKDLAVFKHPSLTRLTLGTAYSLKVSGPQIYYWRVQAYIRDAWSPYTRAQDFVVARQNVLAPIPHPSPIHIARAPTKTPSHPVLAAVLRRSRVRAASRSGGRILLAPEAHQAAQPVRQVAVLVSAQPARGSRPAPVAVPRISTTLPVSRVATRPRPPSPPPIPVAPTAPRSPIVAPRPAPAPKPPVSAPVPPAAPRPPVSPPTRTAAPQPPVSVTTPSPPPPALPAGSVTYPVGRAPASAPPQAPLSPVAPAAAPAGKLGQGAATSSQSPVSAPVSAPTTQPLPSPLQRPKHHVVSNPRGAVTSAASPESSKD